MTTERISGNWHMADALHVSETALSLLVAMLLSFAGALLGAILFYLILGADWLLASSLGSLALSAFGAIVHARKRASH